MRAIDIIRAWKDSKYRQSLSSEEQRDLPEHPAGAVELSDHDLACLPGAGQRPLVWTAAWTAACCQTGTL